MNGDQRIPAPTNAQGATPSDDPAAIERDIRQARSELGRTIDELQERLNPSTLKAQATDAVRGATVGRAEEFADSARETAKGVTTQMMQTMRDNPIPTALAGAGLYWLWRKSRETREQEYQRDGSRNREAYSRNQPRDASSADRYQGQPGYGYQESRMQGFTQSDESEGMISRAADMASGVASQAQDALGQVAGGVQSAAGAFADGFHSSAGAVAGGIQGSAGAVAGGVGNMAETAHHTAQTTTNQLQEWMRDRPLVVAGAALALGATIGLALPETEKERELMGSMSEDVMERAKSTAQAAQEKVRSVAEEATSSAQEAMAS